MNRNDSRLMLAGLADEQLSELKRFIIKAFYEPVACSKRGVEKYKKQLKAEPEDSNVWECVTFYRGMEKGLTAMRQEILDLITDAEQVRYKEDEQAE